MSSFLSSLFPSVWIMVLICLLVMLFELDCIRRGSDFLFRSARALCTLCFLRDPPEALFAELRLSAVLWLSLDGPGGGGRHSAVPVSCCNCWCDRELWEAASCQPMCWERRDFGAEMCTRNKVILVDFSCWRVRWCIRLLAVMDLLWQPSMCS